MSANIPAYDEMDHGIQFMEEERRRIARDLHDGPAQTISALSTHLDIVARLIETRPQQAQQEIYRVNQRLLEATNDIRHLIYDLRPIAVDEIGLFDALQQLCQRSAKDTNVDYEYDCAEDVTSDFSPARQMGIYRLVQELFNNIRKHAEATKVSLNVYKDNNRLAIEIEDNGKGFDPNAVYVGHYGLVGVKERVEYMHGNLDIRSHIGAGSTFTIKIPVYGQ